MVKHSPKILASEEKATTILALLVVAAIIFIGNFYIGI